MALTLQKKQNKCKALITTTNSTYVPSSSPNSYCPNTTIPQPKVKISVPKLLVKAIQRKKDGFYTDSNADQQTKKDKVKGRKWETTHKKIKRVGSIFANVFRYKRSLSHNHCSSSNNDGNCENSLQIVVSNSRSLSEILKIENHQGKKKIDSTLKEKTSLKSFVSFSSYINRGKTRKNYNVKVIQENSCYVGRAEQERGDHELCKKRILMGEKCKPLNGSGILHYDRNGVILPDIVDQ